MDLADRCGRERLRLEGLEDDLGSAAELLADDLRDLGIREWPDLVEELEELVAVGGGQQVEPHRQHLAELDPRAAELLEREAHPDRARLGSQPPERQPWEDVVAAEDADDLPDPSRVPEQRSHTSSGHDERSGERRAGPARRRPAIGTDAGGLAEVAIQTSSSSIGTRRRRFGVETSSSHSRPARTSSAKPCRDQRTSRLIAPSAASWASRG